MYARQPGCSLRDLLSEDQDVRSARQEAPQRLLCPSDAFLRYRSAKESYEMSCRWSHIVPGFSRVFKERIDLSYRIFAESSDEFRKFLAPGTLVEFFDSRGDCSRLMMGRRVGEYSLVKDSPLLKAYRVPEPDEFVWAFIDLARYVSCRVVPHRQEPREVWKRDDASR